MVGGGEQSWQWAWIDWRGGGKLRECGEGRGGRGGV